MDRRVGALLLVGASAGFTVDRDHLRCDARVGRHPGHEALLEPLGIERRENLSQPVVGGRLVEKRPEPAQQVELVFAEPGDVGKRLGPCQHRQQRQQQHLVERIDHLDQLTRIRQIREIIQKNNALVYRFVDRRHPILSQTNHLGQHRFSTSPVCHVQTHSIALV